MQIFSAATNLLTGLTSLAAFIWAVVANGWHERQAVRVERLLVHAEVPGLRDEARDALRREACDLTLWLLAQRKYPQYSSLTLPLALLVVLAPACVVASYPLGMTAPRLVIGSLLNLAYFSVGVWFLSRVARSDADTVTWRLFQATRGAEIERLLPPKLLGGLRQMLSHRKDRVAGHVGILAGALVLQHIGVEDRPLPPDPNDMAAWDRIAEEIDPQLVNTVIRSRNYRVSSSAAQSREQIAV